MKSEYDFSGAERGKFLRKDAVVELPLYLEARVYDNLTTRAEAKGPEVNAQFSVTAEREAGRRPGDNP